MKAFTLIELIFVIVIMGVLSFIAISYIPDNTLSDDTKALKDFIKYKESYALGYEADMNNLDDKKKVCITFDKNEINNEENTSKIRYFIKSDISSYVGNEKVNNLTVCFDKFGRPFENSIDERDQNLLHKNVTIVLQYKNKSKTITIYKITGYVE